ncbi:hypothetical protein HJG54_34160 [Leptolyngbya sp. NK1-12]|uniref:Uncharacterized protein n=1 Tax=Leptolyngbya sp. NK1-12 TaxID=2547451 RepID=A0AA97AJJ4_9CYAN|nr:hypothetical protein [Leptolyngbya sp. NK1-12]WNZ27870.1 hypothetical protein HJG54_34160 [Leptolyngbya sp. NK1-12]
MPKPVNQRCQQCALLSASEARQKACWDSQLCHKRRSFYRHKLALAQTHQVNEPVPVLDVPLPDTVYAILYRYLIEGNILHAIAAELYRGDQLIAKTRPIHCGALTDRVLRMYLQSVLETFTHHSGTSVALFREMVDLPLSRHPCPVADCHLNPTQRLEELL